MAAELNTTAGIHHKMQVKAPDVFDTNVATYA